MADYIKRNLNEDNDKKIKSRSVNSNIKKNDNLGHLNSHKSKDKNLRGINNREKRESDDLRRLINNDQDEKSKKSSAVYNQNKNNATPNVKSSRIGKTANYTSLEPINIGNGLSHTFKKSGSELKGFVKNDLNEDSIEKNAVASLESVVLGTSGSIAYGARRPGKKTVNAVKRFKRAKESALQKAEVKNALKVKSDSAKQHLNSFYKNQKVVREVHIDTAQTKSEAIKESVRISNETAKYTLNIAKELVNPVKEVVKEGINAVVSSISALFAGLGAGGAIICVVIILMMVGALIASPYGIIFADDSDGYSLQTAMSIIDEEFAEELHKIEHDNSHDKVILSNYGCQYKIANWSDIIAVWDIKLNIGDNEDVVTITDEKLDEMRAVVWDMVTITHTTETKVIENDSPHSDIPTQNVTGEGEAESEPETETILKINVEYKSVDDMITLYAFSTEQKKAIYELLSSNEYITLFIDEDGTAVDFSSLTFENEEVNDEQKKVVSVALNASKYGITAHSGMCEAWVEDVIGKITGNRGNAASAITAGHSWSVSKDWSKIQVGATVYGYANNPYGHVGIYIGNGKVIHNLSGCVKVQSLESWVEGFNGICWGWNAGVNLSGDSQYDCVGVLI